MRTVSVKGCRGNQNTHFAWNKFFCNCAGYEITRKNTVGWGRPHMTVWRMHIACWLTQPTHTHTHTHTHTLTVCNITAF
jgi:hypothetical protein